MSITLHLPREQTAKIWESAGPEQSPNAYKLQALFDKGMTQQYEHEKSVMEKEGLQFRLTDGRIYQIVDKSRTIQVPIKFQVKGGSLTWYFDAPKDETHQDFRDEVYGSAALGHKKVDGHCEKYWRGTNSLHVKKMHTNESESGFNHNHYRMNDIDADPKAVYQHLMGFVEAQRELGLINENNQEKFLTKDEALELYKKFSIHWIRMNHVGPAKQVKYEGETIDLSEKTESILSQYKRAQEEKLSVEDKREWEEHKADEQPCIAIANWDSMTIPQRLKAIAEGMRGLGSELAHTRQVEGSHYATVATVVKSADKVELPIALDD